MLGRIVKRDRLIEVRATFRDVSRTRQGNTHDAMGYQERSRGSLFLGECQELRCKLTYGVAVERHIIRDPNAVESGEQQQRVFGRLSERFSVFYQQTCSLRSRRGFRCSIAFDMNERGYERDLKRDLLAPQRGCGGQGRNLAEGASELLYGFDQCRASERPLPRIGLHIVKLGAIALFSSCR